MTKTNLVIIDVIATDRDGSAVEGLSAQDFILKEDDVVQAIQVFEFHRLAQQDSAKSYYVLGYYPRNPELDGSYRRIDVTVGRGLVAKIDYRKGYYARPHVAPNPPAVGDPPRVSNVSDGTSPPQLIHKEEPEYSEEARKAKWQGTVTVYIDIDAAGNVTDAHLIRALGLGLDEKAIAVVKKWKFKPAQKDGKPVATQAAVDVTFSLL